MLKYKLKQLIWALLLFLSLGVGVGAITAVGQVIYYFQSGADPSTALNLVPTLPQDLDERLHWQPDHADMQGLNKIDPLTRQQIAADYLYAWGQLGISYKLGRPYGLTSYFTGPALKDVTHTLTETVNAQWNVDRQSLRHELQVTFYSDDGSIVGIMDHTNHVVEHISHADSGIEEVVESSGVYKGLLLLEDGNWRLRLWHRVADRPLHVPSVTGAPGFVVADGRQLLLDRDPIYIAGLSYYPRDASWDQFWPTYDPERTAQDLAVMRSLGLNTVRIFVPYFEIDDNENDGNEKGHGENDHGETEGSEKNAKEEAEALVNNLVDFVDQVEAAGMWAIVTLFDHRTDHHPSFWAADNRYLAHIIPRLAEHPALIAWDLKNEADLDVDLNGEALVNAWLEHIAAEVRLYDRNHMLTVGWSSPEAAANPVVAEFTDLISYHYFGTSEEYLSRVEQLQTLLPEKPLLLGEFGYSTGNKLVPQNQREAQQAAFYRDIRHAHQMIDAAGYLSWTLYDFNGVYLQQFATPWLHAKQANMGVIRLDEGIKPAATFLSPDADLETAVELPIPWWNFIKRLSALLQEARE